MAIRPSYLDGQWPGPNFIRGPYDSAFFKEFLLGGGGGAKIRKTEKNLDFKVRQKPEGRLF